MATRENLMINYCPILSFSGLVNPSNDALFKHLKQKGQIINSKEKKIWGLLRLLEIIVIFIISNMQLF